MATCLCGGWGGGGWRGGEWGAGGWRGGEGCGEVERGVEGGGEKGGVGMCRGRRTARQAHRHCVSASHTSFVCLYLAVCVFELFGLNKYYAP